MTFELKSPSFKSSAFQDRLMFQNEQHAALSLELWAPTDIEPNLIFSIFQSLKQVTETYQYLWDEWLFHQPG